MAPFLKGDGDVTYLSTYTNEGTQFMIITHTPSYLAYVTESTSTVLINFITARRPYERSVTPALHFPTTRTRKGSCV